VPFNGTLVGSEVLSRLPNRSDNDRAWNRDLRNAGCLPPAGGRADTGHRLGRQYLCDAGRFCSLASSAGRALQDLGLPSPDAASKTAHLRVRSRGASAARETWNAAPTRLVAIVKSHGLSLGTGISLVESREIPRLTADAHPSTGVRVIGVTRLFCVKESDLSRRPSTGRSISAGACRGGRSDLAWPRDAP
jgi:hypothetical protein